MPAALASKDEIVDRLFAVFRDRGFEGSSLTDLSRATGLGKSSLYHHFPGGKAQMAQAVLEKASGHLDDVILGVAKSHEPLPVRVRRIVAAFNQMFSGGRTACVLGQMATADIGAPARQELHGAFAHWIEAVALLARDSAMPPARAHDFAEDWVARLQGALILQAAIGVTGPFRRAMDALLDLAPSSTRSPEPG